MSFTRASTLKPRAASAIVVGLALAAAACSDTDADEATTDAAAGTDTEAVVVSQEVSPQDAPTLDRSQEAPPSDASQNAEPVGTFTVEGETYNLMAAHWCGPDALPDRGLTIALRVAALDENGDIMLFGAQTDYERNDRTVQRVSAATELKSNYQTGDITPSAETWPLIQIEDGTARVSGEVRGTSGDIVDFQAEFSLPDEPGMPGYC